MSIKQAIYRAIRKRSLGRKVISLKGWLSQHDIRVRDVGPGWKVLCVAPHQDDESIGCGGFIKLVTSRGGTVDVVYCSDGRRGFAPGVEQTLERQQALVETRKVEARAACDLLGVSNVHFLGGPDAELHLHLDLGGRIQELLDKNTYDIVMSPWPYDHHSDHQAVWQMTRAALEGTRSSPEVWLYEVWTPLIPNVAIDISSVVEDKRRAVSVFVSQLDVLDYVETSLGLARYRSALIAGAKYAEVYLVGDKSFALSLG